MWRGGCRSDISVSASFVWRCLSGSTMAPFPHPAHRTGQADFPHPACAPFLSSFVIQFFCSTRAASILPARPHISIAVARSGGQGRRFFSAAEGLSLMDASTAAGCRQSGGWPRDDPRGACHWPRSIARTTSLPLAAINRANHACIRLNPYGVQTLKQSYASAGKAPRRRVHSLSGIAAIAECGLPPPRIVIGNPAHQAQSGAEPLFVLSRSGVMLTPPAAARHHPAPRRL